MFTSIVAIDLHLDDNISYSHPTDNGKRYLFEIK